MNKINKRFSYPKEKPKGYFNNLHTKDGGWLHSSNQLLLDITLDKILQKKKVITIFEFGSYMGLSAVYMVKKLNKKCNIICIDHWEGGFTITHKKSNANKNKLKNKLYPQFITNTWEYKDMITPVKMDGREAMKYLYNLGIEPDFIYLDMDHEFEPVYGDLKLLISLFPNTPIAGDDYEFHSGVREAIDTLRPFIQQYNIYTYKNIFLLSKSSDPIIINYYKSVNSKIEKNIKNLIIIHDNYKSVKKIKNKINLDGSNNYYYYLNSDNYSGLELNCIIDSIYKKFSITNIIFYNINYNYNDKFIDYINSKFKNIIFFDSLYKDFTLSFMISYNQFINIDGFDNLAYNEDIILMFLFNIFKNYNISYKPLFNVISNEIKFNYRTSIKNYDIYDLSNYNEIIYDLKSIKEKDNIITVNFKHINFTYKQSKDSLLNPLIYTIFPIEKNNSNKNILINNRINELRNNKIIKEGTINLGHYENLDYDTIFTIFLNYINNYKNILFLSNNKDELLTKTIKKYYKIKDIDYKLKRKNKKYNFIIFYKNEYTKNGMDYYFNTINNLIDSNLELNGYYLMQFYNLPKENDIKEMLKIFGKFEKVIFLKVNNYGSFNNNFWILCYNKLDKKDYLKNIYDVSFYNVLNEIRKYKNIYRSIIKKIKKIDDFIYY